MVFLIDFSDFMREMGALQALGGNVWASAQAALLRGARTVRSQWRQLADTEIKRQSGQYIAGIQIEYPRAGNPFEVGIFNAIPYATTIEYGSAPHDLKPGLLASPRHRVSKKGKRYTIVPFRHKVPSSLYSVMPTEVHTLAKELQRSTVLRRFLDERGVIRYKYAWGGRLTAEMLEPLVQSGTITPLQAQRFAGMVKMGMRRHTGYLTFRTVSESSPPHSWMHPGTPGHHFARRALAMSQAVVVRSIERSVRQALRAEFLGRRGRRR